MPAAPPAAGPAQPGPGAAAGRRGGLPGAPPAAAAARRAVVPLPGAEPGRRRRPPLLPQPGAGLPVRAAPLPGAPLARARPGGQRPAQRQRPPAVGLAGPRRRPARLHARLLVGRRLHALPVRHRPAGRRLPRLPAAGRARQRPLPPLPARPPGGLQRERRRRPRSVGPAARRGVRGVHRRAGRHAGHRGGHDGRRGLHLRHAGPHLPPGGLPDREPHPPAARGGPGPAEGAGGGARRRGQTRQDAALGGVVTPKSSRAGDLLPALEGVLALGAPPRDARLPWNFSSALRLWVGTRRQ